MNTPLAIKVVQDDSVQAGHVRLHVAGVERAPLDETFLIRRVDDSTPAFESDWPSGLRRPQASEWHEETRVLELLVGPDVVNPIPGGTPVAIRLPGVGNREAVLTWPDGLILETRPNLRRGRTRKEVATPLATPPPPDDAEQRRAQRAKEEAARRQAEEAERLRQEQQRMERERLEKARLENERLEQARVEKERREKERSEQQRLENQRLAQERLEAERRELARQVADDIALEPIVASPAAYRPPPPDQQPRANEPPKRRAFWIGSAIAVAALIVAAFLYPLLHPKAQTETGKADAAIPKSSVDDPPPVSPPKACRDPRTDYDTALNIYFKSKTEAARLLTCVVGGSDEELAEKARKLLDDLNHS
jgi:hypothetical protein